MRQSGRFFLCIVFSVLVTGTTFAQVPCLSLEPSDIRLEHVYSNDTFIGYNLFVRKKAGVESVMLTEPSGYHALRSVDWNPVNGYERRELSGVPLSGAYSLYSILSSTPIYDTFLGGAFHLFVPFRVVYGNPSSSAGTAFLYMGDGVQINIRTFDHKYADPNTGRYQNNQFIINDASVPWDLQCPPESSRESRESRPYPEFPPPPPVSTENLQDYIKEEYDELRRLLVNIVGIDKDVLSRIDKGDNVLLQRRLLRMFNERSQRE